jgi:hypothetical protein
MPAKYLFAIFVVIGCSAFSICERKVMVDGKMNRIYIYPDRSDTSTYLKQRFQPNHVVEYLYVNSKLRYKRILDRTIYWVVNEYINPGQRNEQHITDTFRLGIPEKVFDINDSCALNVEYFNDGGYHICTYGYNRANECAHSQVYASTVVFDSLYAAKMMGALQVICDTNTVTDALTSEEYYKIVHRERQRGKWYTFDLNEYKKDSTVYEQE